MDREARKQGETPVGYSTVQDRSYRRPYGMCWNRYLNGILRPKATGFDPDGMQGCPPTRGYLAEEWIHLVVDADIKSYFDTIPHDG